MNLRLCFPEKSEREIRALAFAHFEAFEGGHPGEVGAESLAAFWDRLESGAVPWFVRIAEPLRVAAKKKLKAAGPPQG